MRLCNKHWQVILDGFGHTNTSNLEARINILRQEYGFDPCFKANTTFMHKLLDWLINKGVLNINYISSAIGDSCPICAFHETEPLLQQSIDEVKREKP